MVSPEVEKIYKQWSENLPTRYGLAQFFDKLNVKEVISSVRHWEKSQLAKDQRWDDKQKANISICGSSTLQYLQPFISGAILADGFIPQVNIGAYNQVYQELVGQDERIINNEVDVLWVFCDLDCLLPKEFPSDFSNLLSEKGLEMALGVVEDLIGLLKSIRKHFKGFILINNFFPSRRPPFGIGDSGREVPYSSFYGRVNENLLKFVRELPYAGVFPMCELIGRYGAERAIDHRLKLIADCPFTQEFLFEVSQEIRPYLRAIKGTMRKVLVLDLDNTLWGGVVGEDGWNGVKIGTDPAGKAFLEFQKAIFDLYKMGTVLAINSKNNIEDVREVFQKRKEMVLKLEHFASIRINWNDKATNCWEIAKEINVGLDSFVFWDDNPAERMMVTEAIEEIYVIDPPEDISNWASFVHNLTLFDNMHIGKEDMQRGRMYAEDRQRKEAKLSSLNLDSFYHSLKLKVESYEGTEENLPRIVSLLGRTNQFNLSTKRYTEQEVRKFIEAVNWDVSCYHADDRFGSYGIVGVTFVFYGESKAFLDTFLLSCRAMGKGIEDSMLSNVAGQVSGRGGGILMASYLPTKKNVPIEKFLSGKGFIEESNKSAEILYSIDLKQSKLEIPKHIEFIHVGKV